VPIAAEFAVELVVATGSSSTAGSGSPAFSAPADQDQIPHPPARHAIIFSGT
jgi:hypothetical protein